MLKLEKILERYNNFYVARKRYTPVWGSSVINQVNYDGIEYASKTAKWNWDYMVKISESDFPLAPMEHLEELLRQYVYYDANS
jgi:protein xylosyltransferase